MNDINVKRLDVLDRIRKNRAEHRDLFLKAQDGYRARVIEELDRMLQDAKDGKKIRRAVAMAEPSDHTADYDTVIDMLEMSTDEIIELDHASFKCYVRDEWSWKMAATITNSTYATGSYVAQ